MSADRKVPEIRFKGFSGEWERLSFLDSIERIIDFRGRTPKKLGLEWSPSGYRALSALNVKQGYIDFLIDPHFGDQELYDKWMSGSELHQGQVLFTTEAPMGNVAQIPNNDKYILSQRTIAFQVNSLIIVEDFLAVLLISYKVFQELSALSSGGTAKGISQKVLANLNVSIPNVLYEQTAIGDYFQKLDILINQHQNKHDKLCNIKKAMLEKMFPKSGETIPEIRFKGFSGDWEEKKLEDICDVRDGTHSSPQYHQNGFPLVTSKNVKNGYINYDDVQYISKIDFDEINKRSKVDINDILMGMIGTIGNIALIREAANFAIKNVALIKDKKIINFLYIYYFLQSPMITQLLEDSASGGTQKFISLSNVRSLLTYLPEREEQSLISNYFQKLDNLINQHQQQITKLNNIKQACLSKMFV